MTIFERYEFITNQALAEGTVAIVDNKAGCAKDYECYRVEDDFTVDEIVEELWTTDTYLIRIYKNGLEVKEVREAT